jgi:hypothetical protein
MSTRLRFTKDYKGYKKGQIVDLRSAEAKQIIKDKAATVPTDIGAESYQTKVSVRDSGLNEGNFETLDSKLLFPDADSGVLDLMFNSAKLWGRFHISYRAGYETIPDDLAEAAASLAAYLVNNADSGSVNVKSKQEGQRKVDYSQLGLGGTVHLFKQLGIDDVLNAYANNAVFADK